MKILYVVSAMLPWEVHGLAVHVKYLTEAMCKVADVTILYTVAANISGNKVKISIFILFTSIYQLDNS